MTRLRRDFPDRETLTAYLRGTFADRVAPNEQLSPIRGGRQGLEERLASLDPARYGATRARLDGAVTRLSPWLRHGIVTLAQVRDRALAAVQRPGDAYRLVYELGWRDYWSRVHAAIGDGVWEDREPIKTGLPASAYAHELPEEVERGETGLACVDGFSRELSATGWLHNRARLWLAAYVVHWRRVRWQAGARWFLRHLLDGDLASNNLSWQWVASTFAAKPYVPNRAGFVHNGGGVYCEACPARDSCPFDGDAETLAARLFAEPGR